MDGAETEGADGLYHGLGGYQQFAERKDTFAGNAYKGVMAIGSSLASIQPSYLLLTNTPLGPLRAPTNVRSTIRWDYQPDICKAREC